MIATSPDRRPWPLVCSQTRQHVGVAAFKRRQPFEQRDVRQTGHRCYRHTSGPLRVGATIAIVASLPHERRLTGWLLKFHPRGTASAPWGYLNLIHTRNR